MYQVIEINSAMLRSGKQLLSSFSEATQSHELTKWSAAATAGFFGSAAATSGGARSDGGGGSEAAAAPDKAGGSAKARESAAEKKRAEKRSAASAAAAKLFGRSAPCAPSAPGDTGTPRAFRCGAAAIQPKRSTTDAEGTCSLMSRGGLMAWRVARC